MSQALRVGIVGCGEVTQILHLPALDQLAERVTVSALCDAARDALAATGPVPGLGEIAATISR